MKLKGEISEKRLFKKIIKNKIWIILIIVILVRLLVYSFYSDYTIYPDVKGK